MPDIPRGRECVAGGIRRNGAANGGTPGTKNAIAPKLCGSRSAQSRCRCRREIRSGRARTTSDPGPKRAFGRRRQCRRQRPRSIAGLVPDSLEEEESDGRRHPDVHPRLGHGSSLMLPTVEPSNARKRDRGDLAIVNRQPGAVRGPPSAVENPESRLGLRNPRPLQCSFAPCSLAPYPVSGPQGHRMPPDRLPISAQRPAIRTHPRLQNPCRAMESHGASSVFCAAGLPIPRPVRTSSSIPFLAGNSVLRVSRREGSSEMRSIPLHARHIAAGPTPGSVAPVAVDAVRGLPCALPPLPVLSL
jgi:hypothetical protein